MDEDLSLLERTKRLIQRVDAMQLAARDLRGELMAYGRALRDQLAAMEEAVSDLRAPVPVHDDDAPIPLVDSEPPVRVQRPAAPVARSEPRPAAITEAKPAAPPAAKSAAERRKAARRQGPPVPLLLSYSKGGDDPFKGWVNDCSKTGLGVTVEWALPVSSILTIRPVNEPGRFRWVQIEVRNCRKTRDRWLLGCKFLGDLSAEDLELFEP